MMPHQNGTFVLRENGEWFRTKQRALHDAKKMQQLLGVEITDTVQESIVHLTQAGRKVEAVTLAARALGMTTTQAKDFVEGNDSPTLRSSETPESGRPSP